ncbi:MAG TPA: hypothetical protein VGE11_14265 [Pseudonocardia sp.]
MSNVEQRGDAAKADDDPLENLAAIDHQIAALRARAKGTSPRYAALIPHYQADIDALLDLRLWLTAYQLSE